MTDDKPQTPPDPDKPPPRLSARRYMDEDRADAEPYTDPLSGVSRPIDPRDVLDPEELREYQEHRRKR